MVSNVLNYPRDAPQLFVRYSASSGRLLIGTGRAFCQDEHEAELRAPYRRRINGSI
jgi:hypothetical protein